MNILFDLYGTLIDIKTDESKDSFWQEFADKVNVSDFQELKNKYYLTCARLQEEKEEIEIRDVFKEIVEYDTEEACLIFRELSTEYISLYDGVIMLLEKLKKNHKLFVLSNAQSSFTIPELKKLKIYDYFNGIAISSDYGYKKPNPKFFQNAISDFNIIDDICMIGNDYECDIKPAIKLGLKTIFIESNLTPKNECSNKIIGFNCNEIIENINKLQK